jgi:hypothetical protein
MSSNPSTNTQKRKKTEAKQKSNIFSKTQVALGDREDEKE